MSNYNLIKCKNCGHMFNSKSNSECPKCRTPQGEKGDANLTLSLFSGDMNKVMNDKKIKAEEEKQKPAIFLMQMDAGSDDNKFLVDKENFLIGRLKECDLTLSDSKISRRHAEIRRVKNRFFLMDLGSTNGTFLNDKRLNINSSYKLKAGDTIKIYKSEFSVHER